uniref:Uncharacterized protein n=1 Tax=Pristionchus pacificus TaxID=54126 RepID=A0A2A6BVG5_PRIPA|eukprot:PDM69773.1 hypothetical protein PRIPAC_44869 [Pristionchus pacificus]
MSDRKLQKLQYLLLTVIIINVLGQSTVPLDYHIPSTTVFCYRNPQATGTITHVLGAVGVVEEAEDHVRQRVVREGVREHGVERDVHPSYVLLLQRSTCNDSNARLRLGQLPGNFHVSAIAQMSYWQRSNNLLLAAHHKNTTPVKILTWLLFTPNCGREFKHSNGTTVYLPLGAGQELDLLVQAVQILLLLVRRSRPHLENLQRIRIEIELHIERESRLESSPDNAGAAHPDVRATALLHVRVHAAQQLRADPGQRAEHRVDEPVRANLSDRSRLLDHEYRVMVPHGP